MSCEKSCEQSCGDKSQCCGKLRLHYFNVRGRAEGIRYVLTLAKADWEDVRYSFEDWPKSKPNFPLGQLPVLEWTDKEGKTHHLTQSATILRATSCWFNLSGKTPCEKARADEAFEVIREMGDLAGRVHFEQDADRKAKLLAQLKDEVLPRNMAYLEKRIQTHGGKHLAGGECFTFADLVLAAMVENFRRHQLCTEEHAKATYPGLYALVHAVEEQPEIKAYIAKRPNTDL